ncbi:5-bromo-4-chloroindolyl phosphate hydrolysis family protein [Sulfurovum sp.]|uniref:5-bromo-4-chloroindolyl phosphate hydrolysis family protein n=1 Tax=Sulfurovum sp. TaxID=1969726 RepID=UPI0025F40D86|nr:5-bromo-4-chloroindolyl phosphate hydrolysis family protein [Sulfurovum sp.]
MSSKPHYSPILGQWKRKRGWFFYFFLLPLFFAVIFPLFALNLKALLLNSVAFLLMYTAFRVARKGFEQEDAYHEAKLAKAPQIPFKQLAAALLAVTVFYTAHVAGNYTLFNSLFLSAVSFAGFLLYYGVDPRKDKLKDFGDISSGIVLDMLNETEKKMADITKAADNIEDGPLHDKVQLAVKRSQMILDALTDDPRDIRAARKFLVVYLDGIADVIHSYNTVEEKNIDTATREKLLTLMDDVEAHLAKELKRLKAGDRFDLDVNIDTLKEQIKH